jgi:hypothetical protein
MASYGQLENKKYELIILVEGKIDRPVPLSEFMLSIVEHYVKYLSQRVKNTMTSCTQDCHNVVMSYDTSADHS